MRKLSRLFLLAEILTWKQCVIQFWERGSKVDQWIRKKNLHWCCRLTTFLSQMEQMHYIVQFIIFEYIKTKDFIFSKEFIFLFVIKLIENKRNFYEMIFCHFIVFSFVVCWTIYGCYQHDVNICWNGWSK